MQSLQGRTCGKKEEKRVYEFLNYYSIIIILTLTDDRLDKNSIEKKARAYSILWREFKVN